MAVYKFLATRLLCGFSGSDKYINLNQNSDVRLLYDSIIDRSILTVNNSNAVAEAANNIVRFELVDKKLDKTFSMHIKDQGDGLRFTITNYINYVKLTPGQLVSLVINFNGTNCDIFIQYEEIYKYILEKHTSENLYHVCSDNSPTNFRTITNNTNSFLASFGIIATNDNSYKWSRNYCYGYTSTNYSKKFIGVPFSTNFGCKEFNRIEDIV